ncbi:MAG: KamA family radical SAM protein [Candidatus ainarchaeum sp.]|nr:KamA family radical SAM protein [Candidatus ainarchaeum sp.]
MEEDEGSLKVKKPPLGLAKKTDWRTILRDSVSTPTALANSLNLSKDEISEVCDNYPAMINPYYLSLVKKKGDPIYKQCVPDVKELQDYVGEEDPLCEEPDHQQRKGVPSLVTHRYPDRLLFRVSNQCAMFCRFCTRKRKVGHPKKNPTPKEISEAIIYIKNHSEIRDVILSGGDPLMLGDKQLETIIRNVYNILKKRKNSIIRIGTRMPCVLPQRVTKGLCRMLKKYHPLFINTHFNHPSEITPESRKACGMLVDSGIPMGNQTVLLKGVNDDPAVMKELVQGLINMRVRPYYLYQADLVRGTNHFRTTVQKGLEIYKALRGHTSGLCVPNYVIDAPGGGGKIPLLPEYVVSISKDKVVLKNYENKKFEYLQIE